MGVREKMKKVYKSKNGGRAQNTEKLKWNKDEVKSGRKNT